MTSFPFCRNPFHDRNAIVFKLCVEMTNSMCNFWNLEWNQRLWRHHGCRISLCTPNTPHPLCASCLTRLFCVFQIQDQNIYGHKLYVMYIMYNAYCAWPKDFQSQTMLWISVVIVFVLLLKVHISTDLVSAQCNYTTSRAQDYTDFLMHSFCGKSLMRSFIKPDVNPRVGFLSCLAVLFFLRLPCRIPMV